KQATREIPIVIIAADPVEVGIVPSLARPGENITGVSLMSAVFVGKCVELFRDMLPAMRRVAVLTNAADASFAKLLLEYVDVAARLSGIHTHPIIVIGTRSGPRSCLCGHDKGTDRGHCDSRQLVDQASR